MINQKGSWIVRSSICNGMMENLHRCGNKPDSAVAENFVKKQQCVQSYNQDIFSVLRKANSEFHLNSIVICLYKVLLAISL